MKKENLVKCHVKQNTVWYDVEAGTVTNELVVEVNGVDYCSARIVPLSDDVLKQLDFELPQKVFDNDFLLFGKD